MVKGNRSLAIIYKSRIRTTSQFCGINTPTNHSYFINVLSSDKNIETISQLLAEVKHYIELRSESLQIDFVSKLSRLLTALVLFAILFTLCALAVMFVSMTVAAALTPIVGSQTLAYALIVLCYVIIGMIVLFNRKKWIEQPITHFIASLFLGDILQATHSNKNDNGNHEDE